MPHKVSGMKTRPGPSSSGARSVFSNHGPQRDRSSAQPSPRPLVAARLCRRRGARAGRNPHSRRERVERALCIHDRDVRRYCGARAAALVTGRRDRRDADLAADEPDPGARVRSGLVRVHRGSPRIGRARNRVVAVLRLCGDDRARLPAEGANGRAPGADAAQSARPAGRAFRRLGGHRCDHSGPGAIRSWALRSRPRSCRRWRPSAMERRQRTWPF